MTKSHAQLERIVGDALEYFCVGDGAKRLARAVMRYSFRVGRDSARFVSAKVLHFETGLSPSQLSKAWVELEGAGIVVRDRRGRGPFVATVLPDFWRWNGKWVLRLMADAEMCRVIVTGNHPLQELARLRSGQQDDQVELFPVEATLREVVREMAREEAGEVGSSPPSPRLRRDVAENCQGQFSSTENSHRLPVTGPGSGRIGEWGKEGEVSPGENSTPCGATRPTTPCGGTRPTTESDDEVMVMARGVLPEEFMRERQAGGHAGLVRAFLAENRRALYLTLCHYREEAATITDLRGWFAARYRRNRDKHELHEADTKSTKART